MSVIGIDFGNESCFVAVAKAGGIETIANDYSLRATPSCVAFAGKNRILGVAAKNQQVTNMKNTICGFKRLLGRKYDDPHIQKELFMTPNIVGARPDGGIGIHVNYLSEEHVFSPEQLTAMLFTKLKDTSAVSLQTQINDCVITVPYYFTNAERKALLDAAQIAGLNVLRLMNETTAAALSYGFYRTDLPPENEKPRYVIFVDCGHSSIQVSVCGFTKNKLKMIAATSEQIGGRDFDAYLAEHFANEFQVKYSIDPRTNKRAYVRLLAEVEKLKKQMSANSTKLPLHIECFMNDLDVSSHMQRCDFEVLCNELFNRIENTMKKCLGESKLVLEDIYSVEVVGGSSRIPAIKASIEKVFGKTPSTTLNQDEAVSRGAALQCAQLSPAVRVREFGLTDIQSYPIKLHFDVEQGSVNFMDVFPKFHAAPFSKMLTLNRRDQFNLYIEYADPQNLPYPDTFIGHWIVKGIKAIDDAESPEIKVKVRINNNGIVLVSSAQMLEKSDNETKSSNNGTTDHLSPEPMEVQDEVAGYFSDERYTDKEGPDNAKSMESDKTENTSGGWTHRVRGWFSSDPNVEKNTPKQDKKKKPAAKLIELLLEAQTHGFSIADLNNYFEQECKMITNDRQEKERVDARNALEEFVYDIRGKILDGGELFSYLTETMRGNYSRELDEIEDWLYDEGEDCERQAYKERLTNLQKRIEPIKDRFFEYNKQAHAFEQLGHSIQMAHKVIEQFKSGEEKYIHLTETEILNISEAVEKAETFFLDAKKKLGTVDHTVNPSIKVAEIHHECDTLTTCVRSVLSRPKPKNSTPPPTDTTSENEYKEVSDQQTEANKKPEDKMDIE